MTLTSGATLSVFCSQALALFFFIYANLCKLKYGSSFVFAAFIVIVIIVFIIASQNMTFLETSLGVMSQRAVTPGVGPRLLNPRFHYVFAVLQLSAGHTGRNVSHDLTRQATHPNT